MEYEPAEYQRVEIKKFAPRTLRETAEGRYWRRFKAPLVSKQFGPVTHIDFSQLAPYNFAVTAATRVRKGERPTCAWPHGCESPVATPKAVVRYPPSRSTNRRPCHCRSSCTMARPRRSRARSPASRTAPSRARSGPTASWSSPVPRMAWCRCACLGRVGDATFAHRTGLCPHVGPLPMCGEGGVQVHLFLAPLPGWRRSCICPHAR